MMIWSRKWIWLLKQLLCSSLQQSITTKNTNTSMLMSKLSKIYQSKEEYWLMKCIKCYSLTIKTPLFTTLISGLGNSVSQCQPSETSSTTCLTQSSTWPTTKSQATWGSSMMRSSKTESSSETCPEKTTSSTSKKSTTEEKPLKTRNSSRSKDS